jgi:aminoglycoside phosphotransferase (APT) family kinase protein
MAQALAGWHRLRPPDLEQQPVSYFVEKYLVRYLSHGEGARDARIPPLIRRIEQRVAGVETVPALVHGDLSLHHILHTGQELAFVDLDGVVRSRPEVDLAYVMVQLIAQGGSAGEAAAETFLRVYHRAGGTASRPVLNGLMATFFLRKRFIEGKKQPAEKEKLADYVRFAEWYLNQ